MAADKVEIMEGQAQASSEGAEGNYKEVNDDVDTLPTELLIKHPLENKWTLWFFRNNKAKSWEENQCEVTSFDTVEDFWALFNHIESASKIALGCDYSLFKHGIKPMWEDTKNKNGGRWLFTINRGRPEVDEYWLETVLCLIGEAFDEQSEEICGAVINIRPRLHKIAVWTNDAKKEDPIKRIGRKLKDRLSIPDSITIGYQSHEETMVKTGSSAKNRFIV